MNQELQAGYGSYLQAAMAAIDRVVSDLELEGFDKDLIVEALDEYADLYDEYGQLR